MSGDDRDRTVHGVTADGAEIVRYDRAGKWYIEYPSRRVPVSVGRAAELATAKGAQVFLNRYGGQRFSSLVRASRGR